MMLLALIVYAPLVIAPWAIAITLRDAAPRIREILA